MPNNRLPLGRHTIYMEMENLIIMEYTVLLLHMFVVQPNINLPLGRLALHEYTHISLVLIFLMTYSPQERPVW